MSFGNNFNAEGPAGERFPAVRPPTSLDRPAGHTARALGLGPPPPPGAGRIARRLGIGLFGTLASLLWLWSLQPPPL